MQHSIAMRRLRQDLDWLVSAGLLLAALATAVTGLIADLWDLNDFWYHTVAGYVMGGLAAAHVVLNWGRLVSYGRFRLRRESHGDARALAPSRAGRPGAVAAPRPTIGNLGRGLLSRRGFIGAAVGGGVGLLLGRGLRQPPPIAAGSDVGVVYHEWSKPGMLDALGSVANWGQFPELYKTYPRAPRTVLPEPRLDDGRPTARTIADRRSTRAYSAEPLTLQELSQVLFLTTGISADRWGNARRTAPSSGALYPIETYVVIHNVDGVERGVYHYAIRDHAIEQVRAGEIGRAHV